MYIFNSKLLVYQRVNCSFTMAGDEVPGADSASFKGPLRCLVGRTKTFDAFHGGGDPHKKVPQWMIYFMEHP